MMLPTANTVAPREIVLVLEILFASGPDNKEAVDAVSKIDDTIRPWTVGSILALPKKWCWNWCMTVMGPILPVSNPKRKPPIAVKTVHRT